MRIFPSNKCTGCLHYFSLRQKLSIHRFWFLLIFFTAIAPKANALNHKIALETIGSQAEFSTLAAAPDSATLARSETIKFMVDRKDGRRLWFFNTQRYDYHYAFARDYLSTMTNPVPDHAVFNQREYSQKDRRFEMGSLMHFKEQNLWAVELMAGDTLTAEEIQVLFNQLKKSLWIGNELHFLPISVEQEIRVKDFAAALNVITTNQVFKKVIYQPLTQGRAIGYLRIVKGVLDPATVRSNQILVLEKLPEEVPVVAAIISQEFQAPLAHIALLCGSRGTPNMGLRNALNNNEIQSLDGQLVELNVRPQEFSIKISDRQVAEAYWKSLHPIKPKMPVADLNTIELRDVSALKLSSAKFSGAKAAQLGEVSRIRPGLTTPGGFVVPLAYYYQHLSKPNISALLEKISSQTANATDNLSLAHDLEQLQSAIENEAVDELLITKLKNKMAASGHKGRWILRSSTNAEDLAGFNGAGLYRSIKVKANATDAELIGALKKVWSSVWLQTAYEERAWYGVDHRAVGMAVLVQPYVEGAIANGVAITANPFAEFRPGVLINVEPHGGSVTGAAGDEIPEQHLVYTFAATFDFEILSKSSRMPDEKTLMDKESLSDLTRQLMQLHQHFMSPWGRRANSVDVEFLVMPDHKIVILQARPYQVIYSKEQKMDFISKEK